MIFIEMEGKLGNLSSLGHLKAKVCISIKYCLVLGLKGSLALISMTAALGLGYYMNINSSGAQA